MSPHIKTDWVAGQSFFGPLEGGLVVSVSLATARRLLGGEGGGGGGEGRGGGGGGGAGVLEMCGEWVGYEVAVGLNGRVWVQCEQAYATVLLTNAIVNSQPHDARGDAQHGQTTVQHIAGMTHTHTQRQHHPSSIHATIDCA